MPLRSCEVSSVYDNGGETFDRFTVNFTAANGNRHFSYSMDEDGGKRANGFCQYIGAEHYEGAHLGQRIAFCQLPENVRKKCERICAQDDKDNNP